MGVLEKLWFGNVNPNERKLLPSNKQYELVKLIVQHEEAILPTLTVQVKDTCEKLRECRSELTSLVECEAFVEGFRLGAKIMLEMIGEDNDG